VSTAALVLTELRIKLEFRLDETVATAYTVVTLNSGARCVIIITRLPSTLKPV